MDLVANCLTTGIGSVPWPDPATAASNVLEYCDIPYWPQLFRRSPTESRPQFFEDFPGLVTEGGSLRMDTAIFQSRLEAFYRRVLDFEERGTLQNFAVSENYAAGLQYFLSLKEKLLSASAVKGQIIGPISFGLSVPASDGRPMIYDPTMREALVLNLQMKARWQEGVLRQLNPRTIMFIDEASLDRIYNPFIGYDEEKSRQDLQAILGVLAGLKGVHCCTDTNWPFVLDIVDAVSFDAYNGAEGFLIHRAAVQRFVERGGIIAWGIVPASEDVFKESAEALAERLDSYFTELSARGEEHALLLRNSLITPVCGLGTGSADAAMRSLHLTRDISDLLRLKHGLA